MKTLIIDDEPQSHHILQKLLSTNHPDIQVLESGESVKSGHELILKYHPELVFLDIEMPDGSGFDLLEKMDKRDFNVIFITAHNQYAITAIKFEALDYLLKPIEKNELALALERARKKHKEKITNEQLSVLKETLQNLELRKLPTRIAISTSDGIHYKLVKDIIRVEAQTNYSEFTLVGTNRKLLASLHLKKYVEQFEFYHNFMRVHRSHMVNLHYVDKYVRSDGGYLVMKNMDKVNVSKAYRDELLENLGEI